MKYRKKPVAMEAIHYKGCVTNDIKNFTNESIKVEYAVGTSEDGKGYFQIYTKVTIPTLEGEMLVSKGDYIIKDVNGEFFACKPDIFKMFFCHYINNFFYSNLNLREIKKIGGLD